MSAYEQILIKAINTFIQFFFLYDQSQLEILSCTTVRTSTLMVINIYHENSALS